MQKKSFDGGKAGFVLHGINGGGYKLSAWFDKDANLLDIERRDGKRVSVTDRKQAEGYGRTYKDDADF
ncbi:hypothetical protein [Rhizobium phage RHph_N46]|nr:hypothetical protein [Rhizobium phage RHph_N46]